MSVTCVYFEPTGRIRRYLRRFRFSTVASCAKGAGYCCNARTFLDEISPALTPDKCIPVQGWGYDDARWPKKCEACGYEFSAVPPSDPAWTQDSDPWQVSVDWIYRGPNGEEFALADLPVGAMWLQTFGHGPSTPACLARLGVAQDHHDLPHLLARTPGGIIDLDTFSEKDDGTVGDGWTITGSAPKITAHPSIWFKKTTGWHGWLTEGVLTQC